MRPPRRPRSLSGEDAFLWGEIARLITPLRGRVLPARVKADPLKGEAPKRVPAKSPEARPLAPGAMPPARAMQEPGKHLPAKLPTAKLPPAKLAPKRIVKPSPPPPPFTVPATIVPAPALPGLERKASLRLRRGSLKVEARMDLHGMYQAQAHDALVGFLMRCRAAGHAHVLVVTGKGGPSYDDAFSERGVLRRSVPHWLRAPELRSIVLGFEEAARHHGGAGALYVRLRRR